MGSVAALVIAILSVAGPFGFIGSLLAIVWLRVVSILLAYYGLRDGHIRCLDHADAA